MLSKDEMISCLHKLYRTDPWVNELFNSAGIELDSIGNLLDEIEQQMFFDTVADDGLKVYEKDLGIVTNTSLSLADRRSAVSAKWKMGDKSDLTLIQLIADSWHNGAVDVEFINGKIHAEFVSIYGIPTDIDGLKDAIEQIKPAHLAIYYTFKYRTHGQLTPYTHEHLAGYTHEQIRGEAQNLG